jgi:microcystin degradation protein MlrC
VSKRVLVAAFAMEANTFAVGATTLDDFRAQVWRVGADVRADALGPDSELAAAWRVLEARGVEVVPALAAWSAPRPALAPGVVDEVVRCVLARADSTIDGACVMLHGSAVARDDEDPEGTLLGALRARLGGDRPIAISLDCHAHLTPAMVAAVDVVSAYRTCPHVDTARTGAQAATLLADALDGRIRPVVAMAARPMITPPQLHDNALEPFGGLMRRAEELEAGPVLATGLLAVQPWIDVARLGWKAVATADADPVAAQQAADALADAAWAVREDLLPLPGLDVDAALLAALAQPGPVVLADMGDATNGGSVGDSTELLRAALRVPAAPVLLSVVDPAAAALATQAGVGATIDVTLGSGPPGAYNAATPMPGARVEALFDGAFAYTHPVNAGYRASTGPAARLRVGALEVVVHTRSVGVIDPAVYLALGADPAAAQVVQAKSHVSFRAGFAHLSDRDVLAATDGPTTAELSKLDYRRRPRPLFPLDQP